MKISLSPLSRALLLAGALFSTALSALAAPPANDNFASAVALTTGTAKTGTNAEATLQTGEPFPQGQTATSYGGSVWYTWSTTTAGWYEVNTLGSSFDTILSVWSGSTLTGLTAIHANDEAPYDGSGNSSSQSRLMFQAAASTPYRIAVGGWKSSTAPTFANGTISVIVKTGTAPAAAYAVSSTFTPASVNSASVATTPSFALNITTPAAWMTVDLSLARPDGKFWKNFFFLPGDKTSGTATSGIYTKSLPVPKGMPPGVCKITHLSIDEGTFEYGEDALYPMPASIAGLTVTNTGTIDSTAPLVSNVTVSPASVNLDTGANVTVTVTARITDALAGVEGAFFNFRTAGAGSRSTAFGDFTAAERTSGTAADGTYRKVVTIDASYTPAGTYTFDITPRDQAGNEGVTPASPPTLTVVKTPPATLTTFTISPASVNVTSAVATVTISLTASPNGANTLTSPYVYLNGPIGSSSLSVYFGDSDITASSTTSTTWQKTITVARYRQPGTYAAEVQLNTENAGRYNSITFGTGSNADAPLPVGASAALTVVNTGAVDTTGPVVVSASVTPATVNLDSGADVDVTVTARITDATAGLEACAFDFRTTGFDYNTTAYGDFTAADRISGTANDGTYRKVVTIDASYTKAGTYTFHAFPRDQAGNEGVTPASPPTLTVVKSPPASLTAFTISPASANVTGADATVDITVTASPSGTNTLAYAYVYLNGTSSSASLYLGQSDVTASTTTSTTWSRTLTVPRYLKPDTLAARVYVYTENGANFNAITFGTGGSADAPLPAGATPSLTVANTGSADTAAPVISQITVTPATAAPGDTVTVRLRLQDALSGVATLFDDVSFSSFNYPTGTSGFSGIVVEPPLTTGSNGYGQQDFMDPVSGTANDGMYEVSYTLPFNAKPGTVSIHVSARDFCGNNSTSDTASLTITSAPASPYDGWAATKFTAGDDTTPGGDPERDGLKNLIEFAFGLDPKSPDRRLADPASLGDSTGLPLVTLEDAAGSPRLRIWWWIPTDAAAQKLDYIVEFSDDMENWFPANNATIIQTGTTVAGRHPAYVDDDQAYVAGTPRYVRVRVDVLP